MYIYSTLAKFSQLSTWTGPPMIVDGLEELVVPETPVFATDGAPPPPPPPSSLWWGWLIVFSSSYCDGDIGW